MEGLTRGRTTITMLWWQLLNNTIFQCSCAQYLIVSSQHASLYSTGYHHLTFSARCVELSIDSQCSRILWMNGTIESSHSFVERGRMLQHGLVLHTMKIKYLRRSYQVYMPLFIWLDTTMYYVWSLQEFYKGIVQLRAHIVLLTRRWCFNIEWIKYSKEELRAIKKLALTQNTKMPKVTLETHQSQKDIVLVGEFTDIEIGGHVKKLYMHNKKMPIILCMDKWALGMDKSPNSLMDTSIMLSYQVRFWEF